MLEALKAEFKGDDIQRIRRGEPGADIRHVVIHNGKTCGTILYDSKNHGAWRNDFVTKLKNDQLADQADHAVLVTSVFPAKTKHHCMIDDIIVASPARVVALVQLVRQHMVRTHALRMSNAERAEKTGLLYDFITSSRCAGLLARFESDAAKLLDLQAKEMQQHKVNWQNQGKLICSIARRSWRSRVVDSSSAQITRAAGSGLGDRCWSLGGIMEAPNCVKVGDFGCPILV